MMKRALPSACAQSTNESGAREPHRKLPEIETAGQEILRQSLDLAMGTLWRLLVYSSECIEP